jgi:hypothetical protein
MSESEHKVLTLEEAVARNQEYVRQQEELMARKDGQLSRLSIENANLRAALERKETSNDLVTDELVSRYRMAAHKMYEDDVDVVIDNDAEVVVAETCACIAAWVRVTAVQAGVDDGSDVMPVQA